MAGPPTKYFGGGAGPANLTIDSSTNSMWIAHYFESKDFQAVSFPNLKPSSRAISIRLSEPMILRLKERANERHVPYQSLIKQYIADGLKH